MKLLFVTKQRSNQYGVSIGLINSSNFVANALYQDLGIQTKAVSVVDGNSVDKEIYNYKPTHVFLEALWATPTKVEELAKKYPQIKFNIRVHSKLPFLAMEGMALEWINAHTRTTYTNIALSGNNEEFVNELNRIGYRFAYLPNLYKPLTPRPEPPAREDDTVINISCFGALRPFKNHLQQATAAIQFADDHHLKLRFNINSTRSEQKGENVLKNLRALFAFTTSHELVEWPWMDHGQFLEVLLYQWILVCQVSLNRESFNIVTADHIWNMVYQ
jgi:hypothetical protein